MGKGHRPTPWMTHQVLYQADLLALALLSLLSLALL
jgi:hypothetical protein